MLLQTFGPSGHGEALSKGPRRSPAVGILEAGSLRSVVYGASMEHRAVHRARLPRLHFREKTTETRTDLLIGAD